MHRPRAKSTFPRVFCTAKDTVCSKCSPKKRTAMRLALYLGSLLALEMALADEALLPYSTSLNRTGQPFPATLPVYPADKAASFDWKRYIDESVSDGDRVFRAHLGYQSGYLSQNSEIVGVMDSAADDAARAKIAAEEVSRSCEKLEAQYRERLKADADLLAIFDEFVTHHQKAIEASVRLVGGSWTGGSGGPVAFPAARLSALLTYRRALLDLRESLHFQDMPDIPYPEPKKP